MQLTCTMVVSGKGERAQRPAVEDEAREGRSSNSGPHTWLFAPTALLGTLLFSFGSRQVCPFSIPSLPHGILLSPSFAPSLTCSHHEQCPRPLLQLTVKVDLVKVNLAASPWAVDPRLLLQKGATVVHVHGR